MKVGLIGNYGATNIGDDAILQAILRSHPNHEFVVFSAHPSETHEKFKVHSVPRFPLGLRSLWRQGFKSSIQALKECKAVVLGGGGLFQDNHLFACFLWAWQVYWVRKRGLPLFIYGIGIGPLRTRIGRWLTHYAVDYAVGITVRDQKSYDVLVQLGINPQKMEVTADPAFTLLPQPFEEKTRQVHTYVVSLRPWKGQNQKLIDLFTRFLLKLKQEKSARFIFISMQSVQEHDHQILDPLANRVGGDLVVPKDFSHLIEILSQAEFAIGMRYHFTIAALMTRTPLLPISYSPKVTSVLGNDLAPYLIPLEELSLKKLEDAQSLLSVEYNKFKRFAEHRANDQRDRAAKNILYFEDWAKTLTTPPETDKLTQHPTDDN